MCEACLLSCVEAKKKTLKQKGKTGVTGEKEERDVYVQSTVYAHLNMP